MRMVNGVKRIIILLLVVAVAFPVNAGMVTDFEPVEKPLIDEQKRTEEEKLEKQRIEEQERWEQMQSREQERQRQEELERQRRQVSWEHSKPVMKVLAFILGLVLVGFAVNEASKAQKEQESEGSSTSGTPTPSGTEMAAFWGGLGLIYVSGVLPHPDDIKK